MLLLLKVSPMTETSLTCEENIQRRRGCQYPLVYLFNAGNVQNNDDDMESNSPFSKIWLIHLGFVRLQLILSKEAELCTDSHIWLWSDWKLEPQTVLEVRSAVKKTFSLQTFIRRHGLQLKCSVLCYQPSDEQSFCLFSSLFEGQWAFRATEGQLHLKRLQMENKVETAAGVLRISITQKRNVIFSCLAWEGTIKRLSFF